MISRRHFLSASAAAFAACGGKPGSGFRGYAFVATADPPSIAVVDLLTFAIKSRIDLAAAPSDLVGTRSSIYALIPETKSIEEFDQRSRSRVRGVKLPGQPAFAIPRRTTLWCPLRDEPLLVPVVRQSLRAERPIALPAPVVSMDFSPKAPVACVSMANGRLAFLDLDSRKVAGIVDLSGELGAALFRSDGKAVFVAERARRQLTAVDVESRRVMVSLPLAVSPDRLCMKQDGGQLFVTGAGHDAVVIVYLYRTEIAQTSLSGRRPGDMAVSEGPDFLFVSNPEAGSVTVFDVSTQKVVAVTGVGIDPGKIVITPDQQYALVLNRASGDMAVIRLAAIAPGKAKSAPLFTMIPVGQSPNAAVITEA